MIDLDGTAASTAAEPHRASRHVACVAARCPNQRRTLLTLPGVRGPHWHGTDQRPCPLTGTASQVVKRRLVVSEVAAAEGGEEGDAQVEVLGEGSVLQRVFTLQARPAPLLPEPGRLLVDGASLVRCWASCSARPCGRCASSIPAGPCHVLPRSPN